jgi:hypothetical protein
LENFSNLYTFYTLLAKPSSFKACSRSIEDAKHYSNVLKVLLVVPIDGIAEVSFSISKQEGRHGLSNFIYISTGNNLLLCAHHLWRLRMLRLMNESFQSRYSGRHRGHEKNLEVAISHLNEIMRDGGRGFHLSVDPSL